MCDITVKIEKRNIFYFIYFFIYFFLFIYFVMSILVEIDLWNLV